MITDGSWRRKHFFEFPRPFLLMVSLESLLFILARRFRWEYSLDWDGLHDWDPKPGNDAWEALSSHGRRMLA